jgi:hypothetical protein
VTRQVSGQTASLGAPQQVVGVLMRRNSADESTQSIVKPEPVQSADLRRPLRPSPWAPARRALIPIDLPRRFVDGVAWDEV